LPPDGSRASADRWGLVAELKEISPVQASQADVAPLIKLLVPVVLPRTIQSSGRFFVE